MSPISIAMVKLKAKLKGKTWFKGVCSEHTTDGPGIKVYVSVDTEEVKELVPSNIDGITITRYVVGDAIVKG